MRRLTRAPITAALLLLGGLALFGCTPAPQPTAPPTLPPAAAPTATDAPTATPQPTHTALPTQTPAPSATPTLPGPTATPNPLAGYSVDALAARSYDGGEIVREDVTRWLDAYTEYAIAYTTDDDLRVTALMNVPAEGEGPFPVIVLLHGGIDQSLYEPGDGTRLHADYFARRGYLTISPDYRTYNNTGGSSSPLKIPWSVDVLNLLAALDTVPEADPSRVGVLGHSRGGGVASYLAVLGPALPQLRAVVLYAPLSFDQAVIWRHYIEWFGAQWPKDDALIYGSPEDNPEGYEIASPITYLDRITVPVQIHHGTADRVVPVAWSRDLHERLAALGKTAELYEYPGAEHDFTGDDYRLFLERSLAFFERYVR